MRSGVRGITLIEVMVAGLLGSLLLYTIVQLLIPAMRLSARGTTLVDIDQTAGLLEMRLERAFKSTGLRGVRVYDGGHYLSVHPVLGAVRNSKPDLSRNLTVFSWASGRLTESEVPLPGAVAPAMLTGLSREALVPALATARKTHSFDGVSLFEASLAEIVPARVPPVQEPVMKLRFRIDKDKESLEVKRAIWLVNN